MKIRNVIVLLLSLMLLFSCAQPAPNGGINYNIYPYVRFTLSETSDYFIASVLKGATVESLSIPGEIHTDYGTMPVREFAGFENSSDASNLKVLVLHVNVRTIKEGALDYATALERIEVVGNKGNIWADLPRLKKPGQHFIGWRAGDVFVKEGAVIDPAHPNAISVYEPHSMKLQEGKEPTCTQPGRKSYYECSICHELYLDAEGHIPVTLEELNVPAYKHDLKYHEEVPATCTNPGIRSYYECKRCNLYFSDENGENKITDIIIAQKPHSLRYVVQIDPTCQRLGIIAHYHCDVCNKNFSDADGKIELDTVEIAKVDHKSSGEWSKNTESHWKKCIWCSYEFDKADHDFDEGVFIKEPSNKEKGLRRYTCNTCGHENDVEVPEHDHVTGETKVVLPTCFKQGYTLDTCAYPDCGVVVKTNYVPALEHEGIAYYLEEPTCMEDGHIAYFHCNICGYNFESKSSKDILENIVLKKVAHEASSAYECGEDYHWNDCIYECGTKLNVKAHKFDQKNTSGEYKERNATCTSPAIYHYSCICSAKGSATFSDGSALGHNITQHVFEKPATCTEDGNVESWYCDRCGNHFIDEGCTSSKQPYELVLKKLGHDYQFEHDDNQHWQMCSRCYEEKANSRGDHVWAYDIFGRQYCTVCNFFPAVSQGGFDVSVIDKTPLGHLEQTVDGNSVSVKFVNDNSAYPPTKLVWYLNDTALVEFEGNTVIKFNMDLPLLYRVKCEYENDFGARSENLSIRNY